MKLSLMGSFELKKDELFSLLRVKRENSVLKID